MAGIAGGLAAWLAREPALAVARDLLPREPVVDLIALLAMSVALALVVAADVEVLSGRSVDELLRLAATTLGPRT